MGSLVEDTSVVAQGGRLSASLSEDWGIWGPNGGYLASIAMRAVGTVAPPGHRPATFSCQYLSSPRFEHIDLDVSPVRRGRSAWCVNIALTQGDKLCLQAQVWTTDRLAGPRRTDAKMPDVPPPSDLRPIETYLPRGQPKHPFWAHYESRPVRFHRLGEPNRDGARSRTWQRLIDFDAKGDPFLDAARSLVLIDTMPWPTFHHALPEAPTYTAPSLDLTVWFHESAMESAWLLADSHADQAGLGLIHGGGRIWSEQRRLIATGGSQLLVIGG